MIQAGTVLRAETNRLDGGDHRYCLSIPKKWTTYYGNWNANQIRKCSVRKHCACLRIRPLIFDVRSFVRQCVMYVDGVLANDGQACPWTLRLMDIAPKCSRGSFVMRSCAAPF